MWAAVESMGWGFGRSEKGGLVHPIVRQVGALLSGPKQKRIQPKSAQGKEC